jgi:hypothetical protein
MVSGEDGENGLTAAGRVGVECQLQNGSATTLSTYQSTLPLFASILALSQAEE